IKTHVAPEGDKWRHDNSDSDKEDVKFVEYLSSDSDDDDDDDDNDNDSGEGRSSSAVKSKKDKGKKPLTEANNVAEETDEDSSDLDTVLATIPGKNQVLLKSQLLKEKRKDEGLVD
ncbi:MAG: hypothetical protein Q8755_03155, partial [Candidatus Phytoplasma australasiaticum]|nr:hypothetical protein [Candidatus Phytoplasma australasiaticum]